MLLAAFLHIVSAWRTVSPQQRTYQRAVHMGSARWPAWGGAFSTPVRSQIIWTNGGQQRSWSGDYFAVAPTPYRKRQNSRLYDHDPAYLLTSVPRGSAHALLQIYCDRWQIKVNHREETDTLGVGQAQPWNPISVPKKPAFAVAAYSVLLLAGLQAFGTARGPAFAQLPRWRRKAKRPSCLDLITLLRQKMTQRTKIIASFGLNIPHQALTAAAAA